MKALGRGLLTFERPAGYGRRDVLRDALAGLVLSALLIPAGIGYATEAGLPAIVGLYASVVPLVVYALMGPSRMMVLGPDSALIPLIAGLVIPLSHGDRRRAVALASLLALTVGVVCLCAALARFGFRADLLSLRLRQRHRAHRRRRGALRGARPTWSATDRRGSPALHVAGRRQSPGEHLGGGRRRRDPARDPRRARRESALARERSSSWWWASGR